MIGEEAELPLKSQIIERLSPLESSVLLLRTPWKFTSFSLSFSFSKEKKKKSFPSKCSFLEFQESFHKFFWWQGFAFTCCTTHCVVAASHWLSWHPTKKYFSCSSPKNEVESCHATFFPLSFCATWWLETLYSKTCPLRNRRKKNVKIFKLLF